MQADGKIVVGGAFNSMGGQTRNGIARLNPDGSLDTSFDPNANREVDSLAVQADGKLVVGGAFSSIGGQPRNDIARLNPDGSLDATFDPNVTETTGTGAVEALAVQADGKIVVGGVFTSVDGQTRNNIARLNPDGSLDACFDPNASFLSKRLRCRPMASLWWAGCSPSSVASPATALRGLIPTARSTPALTPTPTARSIPLRCSPTGKISVRRLGQHRRPDLQRHCAA